MGYFMSKMSKLSVIQAHRVFTRIWLVNTLGKKE